MWFQLSRLGKIPKVFPILAFFYSCLYLTLAVGGAWVVYWYADDAFASFTSLERHGNQIGFHYYFGWSREFDWRDVRDIVRAPNGKHNYIVRFVMRDGTTIKSIDTDDEGAVADSLALKKDIQ